MKTKRDIFRPLSSPARDIYAAFQKEALKRDGKTVEEWTERELRAVHRAARLAALDVGKRPPSIEDVAIAELGARGHVDYGAKWAYGVARLIQKTEMV